MAKQLDFTKKEQKEIPELITGIGSILIKKLKNGVEAPTLVGNIDFEEGIEVVFEITAKQKQIEKMQSCKKCGYYINPNDGTCLNPNCENY